MKQLLPGSRLNNLCANTNPTSCLGQLQPQKQEIKLSLLEEISLLCLLNSYHTAILIFQVRTKRMSAKRWSETKTRSDQLYDISDKISHLHIYMSSLLLMMFLVMSYVIETCL